MAEYQVLKSAIQQVIKENHNNEITGVILQQSLLSMIDSLGAGYQFMGVAVPVTNPGTPDQKVFYLAGAGTYPNFSGLTIDAGKIGVLYYDTAWHSAAIAVEPVIPDNSISDEKLETPVLIYKEIGPGQTEAITEFTFEKGNEQFTIVINKDISRLGNSPSEAISAWWAAQTQGKLDDIQGFTINATNIGTTFQTIPIIKAGKTISAFGTGVSQLIFRTSGGGSVPVNATDLPYTTTADLTGVKVASGTVNVAIRVMGELDKPFPVAVEDSGNDADLDISDENGNVLARFKNGHFRVKNFDSSKNNANLGIDSVTDFSEDEDYAIGDIVKYGGLLYKFIETHEAGAWDDTQVEQTNVMQHPVDVADSGNMADLDVTDESGNVLARFENGHFRTKNFNSAKFDFLRGKKILFFGDSQTFYDNYVKAFVNMTGCIAYRRGYPGSGFENGATTGTTISFCDRVDAAEDNDLGIITDYNQPPSHIGLPSEIDYIILQGGGNDFGKWESNHYSSSNSFGEISESVNKKSFVGAIRYVLTKLKEKYPFAHIFVTGINYINRVNGGVLDMYATNVVTSVIDDPNSAIQFVEIQSLGKNVNDFNDAMKLVSSLYGAYYVDLTSMGFSSIFQNDRERFYFDGLHFSEHGGKLMAKKILVEMQNNLIY